MIALLKKERWSPYWVGLGIALLSLACFLWAPELLGTSRSLTRLSALIWRALSPAHLSCNPYYQAIAEGPWIDWQMMLVLGLPIGAYLSRKLSGQELPPSRRRLAPFLGGIFILFGARLAGGCTSGQAISAGMQLACSSWLFMAALFATGIPTAYLLYRRGL